MLIPKKSVAAALFALLAVFSVAARGRLEGSAKEAALSFLGGDAVAVREGTLHGFEKDGAPHWFGVPYAAPPAGDLRWKAPRPAETWEGIRDATKAESASQMGLLDGAIALVGSEAGAATLDITRPATAEANLPVFFHIHGGNNQSGSGAELPATRLAQDLSCVAVSVNHRLGLWALLPCPRSRQARL